MPETRGRLGLHVGRLGHHIWNRHRTLGAGRANTEQASWIWNRRRIPIVTCSTPLEGPRTRPVLNHLHFVGCRNGEKTR
jgi:hypothetical protein